MHDIRIYLFFKGGYTTMMIQTVVGVSVSVRSLSLLGRSVRLERTPSG